MRLAGTGVAVVSLARLAGALERRTGLAERLFCAEELAYAATRSARVERLGARLAAKLGTRSAIRQTGEGIPGFREVEVVRGASGAPALHFHGISSRFGAPPWRFHVALSHAPDLAFASIWLELESVDPDSVNPDSVNPERGEGRLS